jgi:hypothetical protein
MIRVMHHMADAPRVLAGIRQVLQPEAVFILEFANKRNLKAIMRYFLRRQSWSPYTPEPYEFAALNFDFHPVTMRHWLRESRFTIERQLTVSHFRARVFKRVIPLEALVAMDALFQWTGNWWQFTPSVFVRARAVGDTPIAAAGEFFRCPACGHFPLPDAEEKITCPNCASQWPVAGGIYDFTGKPIK